MRLSECRRGDDLGELHSFAPSSPWNTEQQLNSTLDVDPERRHLWGMSKRKCLNWEKNKRSGFFRSDPIEKWYWGPEVDWMFIWKLRGAKEPEALVWTILHSVHGPDKAPLKAMKYWRLKTVTANTKSTATVLCIITTVITHHFWVSMYLGSILEDWCTVCHPQVTSVEIQERPLTLMQNSSSILCCQFILQISTYLSPKKTATGNTSKYANAYNYRRVLPQESTGICVCEHSWGLQTPPLSAVNNMDLKSGAQCTYILK